MDRTDARSCRGIDGNPAGAHTATIRSTPRTPLEACPAGECCRWEWPQVAVGSALSCAVVLAPSIAGMTTGGGAGVAVPDSVLAGLTKFGSDFNVANNALRVLHSAAANVAQSDDPAARERLQAEISHTVGLVCVSHLLTQFEICFPQQYWHQALPPADVERLKAYRHIRWTAVEGLGHVRSEEDRSAFDAVMGSSTPIPGVSDYDGRTLKVSSYVQFDLSRFLSDLITTAIVELHRR